MSETTEDVQTWDEEEQDQEQYEEQAIVRRPRRRLLTPVTALLFALLLSVGGFIIGVEVEKGETSSSGSSRSAGRLAGLLGAAGAGATGGFTGASAPGGSARAGSGEAAGNAFGGPRICRRVRPCGRISRRWRRQHDRRPGGLYLRLRPIRDGTPGQHREGRDRGRTDQPAGDELREGHSPRRYRDRAGCHRRKGIDRGEYSTRQ
jgi:hypothetical protein